MDDIEVPAPVEGISEHQQEVIAKAQPLAARVAKFMLDSEIEWYGRFQAKRRTERFKTKVGFLKSKIEVVTTYYLTYEYHDVSDSWGYSRCVTFLKEIDKGMISKIKDQAERMKEEAIQMSALADKIW